jgi:hypothetical protein
MGDRRTSRRIIADPNYVFIRLAAQHICRTGRLNQICKRVHTATDRPASRNREWDSQLRLESRLTLGGHSHRVFSTLPFSVGWFEANTVQVLFVNVSGRLGRFLDCSDFENLTNRLHSPAELDRLIYDGLDGTAQRECSDRENKCATDAVVVREENTMSLTLTRLKCPRSLRPEVENMLAF